MILENLLVVILLILLLVNIRNERKKINEKYEGTELYISLMKKEIDENFDTISQNFDFVNKRSNDFKRVLDKLESENKTQTKELQGEILRIKKLIRKNETTN